MIKKYECVYSYSAEKLTTKVQEKLDDGWLLHGDTKVVAKSSTNSYQREIIYIQAIVKEN